MAVNEIIVTGRKFRKLIDEATKQWLRISYWTKASDVEFDDGKNAEEKFNSINTIIDEKLSSFEDAKSTIINSALGIALGFTAETRWDTIIDTISKIPSRNNWSSTITTANGSVIIPAGYHNGNGVVNVSGLYVPPTRLTGSVSFGTLKADGFLTKHVNFSSPFSTVPTVTTTGSGSNHLGSVTPQSYASNITVSGCDITVINPYRNDPLNNVTVSWVAVP